MDAIIYGQFIPCQHARGRIDGESCHFNSRAGAVSKLDSHGPSPTAERFTLRERIGYPPPRRRISHVARLLLRPPGVPEFQATEKLRVDRYNHSRQIHRKGTYAHGECDSPVDKESSRCGNGNHIVGSRPA
jgi:hypothetical protein